MKIINKKFQEPIVGAYAPLFDRLIDHDLSALEDLNAFYVLDLQGLKESIIHEIELIFNTRPTSKRLPEENDLQGGSEYDLPIYFGLNDFSWFDSSQEFTLHQIGKKMETLIMRFEPRLLHPYVHVSHVNRKVLGLDVSIKGDVWWNNTRIPMQFPITVKHLFSRP